MSKHSRSIFFFAWLLLFALNHAADAQVENQPSAAVPPAPAERRDRFGIYNWGVDYAAYPANAAVDRLNWAAEKVAEIGARTIRVAMPGDIYQVGESSDELPQAAARPAYDRLFSDPRFKTYLLTCKSSTEVASAWTDGYSQEEYDAVRDELRRLGEYLLSNPKFAGKTFIILNWEGDNAMTGFENKQSIWDAYTSWIQSRVDGIKLARQRYPHSPVSLFSGLEFNLVRSSKTGQWCGTPVADPLREDPLINRCVIDYVAPRVDVDYYSLSSWWTLDVKFQGLDASYKEAFNTDLSFALAQVRRQRPDVTPANFIIGEFGIHRTRWSETTVADFVNEIFDALEAPDSFKGAYAIFWQIIDNGPTFYVGEDGFGLYRSRNGIFSRTRAGEVFQRRLAGQSVAPWVDHPLVRRNPPGVTGRLSGTPEIALTDTLVIEAEQEATGFSVTGNRISIEQGLKQYWLTRENTPALTEDALRVTVAVPRSLRPGAAIVYLTNAHGVESNAQGVLFTCATCPQLDDLEDERQLNEFYPGVIVTLRGQRFAPHGNTVTIEQQTEQQVKSRLVVPRADVLAETPEQIKLRLPQAMISTRFSAVIVADAQGRESNEWPFQVYEEKSNAGPAINRFRPIFNQAAGTTNIPAGAVITILGGRFATSGNTVIVEQGDQRFTLRSGAGWSESPTAINVKLPDALLPGRAQVYVVDPQGRESRARAFNIARSLPASRPPIRREPRNLNR